MMHLTPDQIFKIIDHQADSLSKELLVHVESCRLCRKEINIYHEIESDIKAKEFPKTSVDFTDRIMTEIIIPNEKFVFSEFISKKGYYLIFFLMAIVLIYILFLGPDSANSGNSGNVLKKISSDFNSTFNGTWESILESLRNVSKTLGSSMGRPLFYLSLSILLLYFLDKKFYKKFMKMH